MSVTITFTDAQFERFKQIAYCRWPEAERDRLYMNAVEQGNADDTFADGDTQGSAEICEEILKGHIWADKTLLEPIKNPHKG